LTAEDKERLDKLQVMIKQEKVAKIKLQKKISQMS